MTSRSACTAGQAQKRQAQAGRTAAAACGVHDHPTRARSQAVRQQLAGEHLCRSGRERIVAQVAEGLVLHI